MKNRDRLRQINELEMLEKINSFFDLAQTEAYFADGDYTNGCIIDAITDERAKCPNCIEPGYKTECESCIAKWLNSEYDGRW